MELLLLGPVELRVGGQPVALGARQQRAVLAMLALEAGRVVSADAETLLRLGLVAHNRGDHAAATARYEEVASLSRRCSDLPLLDFALATWRISRCEKAASSRPPRCPPSRWTSRPRRTWATVPW